MSTAQRRGQLGIRMTILLVAVAAASAAAAGHGTGLRVTLDQPFEVAGTLFPAGELRLEHVRDYTPGVALHEVSIDGRCLGIFPARRGRAESLAARPAVVFSRRGDGALVLVGYVRPGSGGGESFRFRPQPRAGNAEPPSPETLLVVTAR